ncbi:MAG: hypothetical protein H6581_30325 [Bacteroidia bacterium]|nr:hypothetical protein [Bacteroidia bacterium]
MKEFLAYFDAQMAMQALQVGAGLVMAITATEALVRFQVYAKGGILSWDLVRRTGLASRSAFFRNLGDFFYQERRFRVLMALRMLLGLAMVTSGIFALQSPFLMGAALLSSLLVLFRAAPGQDGSFQLRILIQCVLFTCSLSPPDSLIFRLGMWFLSAQLILSYLLAGVAKLRGPAWRDGSGLTGIFGTVYHGSGWVYGLLAGRKGLSRALSWGVIAFELLFPLVLTGQSWLVVVFLVVTTLFHLSTSFLMGLNGFFLSFVAAYPALIWCLGQLPWADW